MELLTGIETEFRARYGRDPDWIAAAPGRVNLIGEHVDYNDGWVLPMAIDRSTLVAGGPSSDDLMTTLQSTCKDNAIVAADWERLPSGEDDWGNYVIGVMALWEQAFGPLPRMQLLVHSDIPAGAGLSSSAALEVATATLLEWVTGRRLDGLQKAELCQRAERLFAGVPCGLMDPYTSVHGVQGNLLWLDCRSKTHRLIPFDETSVSLVVVHSHVHHDLADGAYALRREECHSAAEKLGVESLREAFVRSEQLAWKRLDEAEARRARHAISEIDRTQLMVSALRRQAWGQAGQLLYESHASLRDDYEVSCPELDLLVEAARKVGVDGGVWGARMTGGGFGGCIVALVRANAVDAAADAIAAEYRRETGREASWWEVHAAGGARVLKSPER